MGYASRYLTPINTLLLPIVPEFVLQDIDSDFYRLQQILYGHTGKKSVYFSMLIILRMVKSWIWIEMGKKQIC